MRRRAVVIAAVALTAWLLMLAGQRTIQMSPDEPTETQVVSSTELSRLHPGMTYEACVRIIGAEGSPYGSSESPDTLIIESEWVSFVWRNSEDSYATVSFHNGKAERIRAYNVD